MVFEWFMAGLNSIFDPIIYFFGPNKFLAVFVIGAVISFVTTLANKLLVDQDRLMHLQSEACISSKRNEGVQSRDDGSKENK